MKQTLVAACVIANAVLLAAGVLQEQAPTLRILSPEDRSYQSRDVLIKAAVEPPGQPVDRMTFFVDGRRVCTVERPPFECTWDVGVPVREHTFRVVAYLAGGRSFAQTVRSKAATGFMDSAEVDVVHVTVTALDGANFATGLPREAFHVYEDDVEQPITYFADANIPLELIVSVDVSESMATCIDEMKENVKHFLSALKPSARVTLTSFNDNFYILARPAVDPATRLESVDHLAPFGSTALHDSLIRSFDLLGRQTGRHALVVFSDGDDRSSRTSREAVERRAETSDAVLYMIGQGRAVGEKTLKALCERLAQKSGGRAFFPRTMEEVRPVFDEILAELSHQYLLGYAPPSSKRDSTWHRIRVDVAGGKYVARTRQGYRFRTSE